MEKEIFKHLSEIIGKSYSPYSGVRVSAAINYVSNGRNIIEYGINVENVSYSLTNCAERTAVFSAVAKGMTAIKGIYLLSNIGSPIMPCGACRQVLAEFIKAPKDVMVTCFNLKGDKIILSFEELFPKPFSME